MKEVFTPLSGPENHTGMRKESRGCGVAWQVPWLSQGTTCRAWHLHLFSPGRFSRPVHSCKMNCKSLGRRLPGLLRCQDLQRAHVGLSEKPAEHVSTLRGRHAEEVPGPSCGYRLWASRNGVLPRLMGRRAPGRPPLHPGRSAKSASCSCFNLNLMSGPWRWIWRSLNPLTFFPLVWPH